MVILNAHNVTDTSGEGFAVRLFRKGNQRGFIRALSDQASFFAAGFNKVRHSRNFKHMFSSMKRPVSQATSLSCHFTISYSNMSHRHRTL